MFITYDPWNAAFWVQTAGEGVPRLTESSKHSAWTIDGGPVKSAQIFGIDGAGRVMLPLSDDP
jgi:hypothetical protein